MASNIITISEDGSPTLVSGRFGESYHSTSGAVEESMHVFINNGLIRYCNDSFQKERCNSCAPHIINVLEYGFGTGLNALLTCNTVSSDKRLSTGDFVIRYTSIEKYPLDESEWSQLDYGLPLYDEICKAQWDCDVPIHERFVLHKVSGDFLDYPPSAPVDVVFFDAFSPNTQPELWSADLFSKIASAMSDGAVFVTYSAKGIVKEALRSVGLIVKRLPGIGRKRHIVMAYKPLSETDTTRINAITAHIL